MGTELRENKKHRSIKRLFKSFKYAFEGIHHAFKFEQNLSVHIIVGIIVIITGLFVKLSLNEWAILTVVMTMVIALEMINTSLEAMVDLVTDKFHPLAKIVKDCASGAVLIMTIGAIVTGLIIFIPKFL